MKEADEEHPRASRRAARPALTKQRMDKHMEANDQVEPNLSTPDPIRVEHATDESTPPAVYTATGLEVATFGDRAIAALMDWGLVLAAYIPVFIISSIVGRVSGVLGFLVSSVGIIAVWGAAAYVLGWLPGLTGQSPGKRVMGLRVVNGADGELLGGSKHLVRAMIGGFLNGVVCYAGWLWPLFDKQRQTWADKLVTSQVVKHPKGSFLPIFPDGNPF